MQQNVDPTPKTKRDQWRVHPIWQLIGTIFTATGVADLVLGYYPNSRTTITIVSILGGVLCVVVLLWNPLIAAWHSGYAGFRSVFSIYMGPYTTNKAGARGILLLAGVALFTLGTALADYSESTTPKLIGLCFLIFGFVLLCLRTSSLLNKKKE